MYIPPAFREEDLKQLHILMNDYSFATLVTQQDGVPLASHLPFMLDTERGQYGVLTSHMARPNLQWQAFDGTQEVLVILVPLYCICVEISQFSSEYIIIAVMKKTS